MRERPRIVNVVSAFTPDTAPLVPRPVLQKAE